MQAARAEFAADEMRMHIQHRQLRQAFFNEVLPVDSWAKNFFTARNDGIPACPPGRVAFKAAVAAAKRMRSSNRIPRAKPMAYAP